jgi:hypothetical protein
MNYLSTESFESAVFPGVRVQLRKMSQKRRAQFNLAFAALLRKERDMAVAREPLEQEYLAFVKASEQAKAAGTEAPPEFPEDKLDQLGKAWAEQRLFNQDEMTGPLLKWGVQSIDGLSIDGAPATADSLIEAGMPELADEIAHEITRVMRLSAVEIKNSESPTTSGAVADGATTNTTAAPAESATSTSSATATGTSPS